MAEPDIILSDIGGTNARFARMKPNGRLHGLKDFPTADFPRLSDALNTYKTFTMDETLANGYLAIAGPVPTETFLWPNGWNSFSVLEEERRTGLRLCLMNDFEAAAHALPFLKSTEKFQVSPGKAQADGTRILLGPGTGLGMASISVTDDGYKVQGRGGDHPPMPLFDRRDRAIHEILEKQFGYVSVERVCCGPGLVNIGNALCKLDGKTELAGRTPAEISQAALGGACPLSREALDRMMHYLGWTAASYAKKCDAKGGIYIGGGIIRKLGPYFERSPFRQAFEANAGPLSFAPTYLICHPERLAFKGLRSQLRNMNAAP